MMIAILLATCAHATRGETRPVDLDAVARAHREAERLVRLQMERVAAPDPLAAPYESGLPACRGRARRTKAFEGRELAGTVLHFGPRAREGAVHVVTSARALREAIGGVLATRELAAEFGVRCAPSTVRVRKREVEIDEGD